MYLKESSIYFLFILKKVLHISCVQGTVLSVYGMCIVMSWRKCGPCPLILRINLESYDMYTKK